jgi:hypothetical protein
VDKASNRPAILVCIVSRSRSPVELSAEVTKDCSTVPLRIRESVITMLPRTYAASDITIGLGSRQQNQSVPIRLKSPVKPLNV